MDDLDALGNNTPVIPGVMPFVSIEGTRRMAALNGTEIPHSLGDRLNAVAHDPDATRALGVAVATDLVERLLDLDVPGIHLYAMNRAQSIREIYRNLGMLT